MINPTKDNFTQTVTNKEILDGLKNSKDNYYRAWSISEDEDLEMDLNREPNSYFADNYFDAALKTWQTSMDIQPIFNKYKVTTSRKLKINVHVQ